MVILAQLLLIEATTCSHATMEVYTSVLLILDSSGAVVTSTREKAKAASTLKVYLQNN